MSAAEINDLSATCAENKFPHQANRTLSTRGIIYEGLGECEVNKEMMLVMMMKNTCAPSCITGVL